MAQDLVARACADTFKIFTKQLLQELCIAFVVLFIESVIQESLHCGFFLLFGFHIRKEKERKTQKSLNDLCAWQLANTLMP